MENVKHKELKAGLNSQPVMYVRQQSNKGNTIKESDVQNINETTLKYLLVKYMNKYTDAVQHNDENVQKLVKIHNENKILKGVLTY